MSDPLAVLRIIMLRYIYTQLSAQLHEKVRVDMTGMHFIHTFYIQARQSINPLRANTEVTVQVRYGLEIVIQG